MNKLRILFVLMIVFTLAACVPQGPRVQTLPGKRPAPPETARRPTDGSGAVRPDVPVAGREQADIAYLDERLSAYEEKYQKWQALAGQMGRGKQEIDGAGQGKQCLRYAGTVFDYYDRLREQATLPAGATGRFKKKAIDPWEASRADIAYLESDCDTVHEQIRERLAQRDRELSEPARKLEGVIAAYVENRQYNEALAAYRNLERRFPGWEPSLKTRHAYGLALLRTNQLDQAGQVLREVLPQLEPGEQPAVKLLLADLLWATHQFEEARDLYQSLAYQHASRKESENWVAQQLAVMETVDRGSEEMAAYISLLQIYLAFDGRQPPPGLEDAVARIQARFPGSIISQRAQQILQATGNQASSWINEQISEAASLREQKQFPQALAVLKKLQHEELSPEARQMVQQLLDEILLAEAAEQEKDRLRQGQDVATRWEEASQLFELNQFDEANEILATLIGTEYDDRARLMMKEGGNRAAAEMRKQAANLFIKARESANPERKMTFLMESRLLLKNLLEKYPEADVASNAIRNLQVIDQNIVELNPGVVLQPVRTGR